MKIYQFEDLDIWKKAILITKNIYDFTSTSKFSKDFELRDQTRRSAISISSNIVEGFEKNNNNEFRRYLKIAKGSAGELRNQMFIALIIGYIKQSEFDEVNDKLLELSAKIGKFIVYLENQKSRGNFQKT